MTAKPQTGIQSQDRHQSRGAPGGLPLGGLLMVLLMVLASWSLLAAPVSEQGGGAAEAALPSDPAWIPPTNPFHDTNNQSVGGQLLVNSWWWEGRMTHTTSSTDWDGDGVPNAQDAFPYEDHLPLNDSATWYRCADDPTQSCVANLAVRIPTTPQFISDEDTSYGVGVADLDRDGDRELVTMDRTGWRIHHNTRGEFNATPDDTGTLTEYNRRSMHLYDVNGDGWVDLLDAGTSSPQGRLYYNNEGSFNTSADWNVYLGASEYGYSLRAGDLDGNGHADLVLATHETSGNVIRIYSNSGSGPSTSATTLPAQSSSYDVMPVDLNGDGWLDLLEATTAGTNSIYWNNAGSFNSSRDVAFDSGAIGSDIAVGDLDQDGDLDVVMTGLDDIDIYEGTGTSISTSPDTEIDFASNLYNVEVGDMNADGWLDIIYAASNEVSILLNRGDGVFPTSADWTATDDSGEIEEIDVADIDADGSLDIAVARDGRANWVFYNGGSYLEPNPSWTETSNSFHESAVAADMNGDGRDDLVLANGSGKTEIWFGQASGAPFTVNDRWRPTSSSAMNDVAVGDVNDDGVLDLVQLRTSHVVDFQFGPFVDEQDITYSGSNDQSVTIESNTKTKQVHLGDIDDDGDADLLVVSEDQCTYLYRSDGNDFETTPHWSGACSNSTQTGALGDIDGDGDLDLVLGMRYERDLIYLNTGSNFTSSPSHSLGLLATTSHGSVEAMQVIDFDGDGNNDIVTFGIFGPDRSAIYLGPFSGFAIQEDITFASGAEPRDGMLVDIDLDGDLDAVMGTYENGPQVWVTDGGGAFWIDSTWSGSTQPDSYGMAVGDFNGDGHPDLGLANRGSSNQAYLGGHDTDHDWIGDGSDLFDHDPTQHADVDNDDYGDSATGFEADSCVGTTGFSWRDRWGCADEDGDGQSNLYDDFWREKTQWSDADGDGLGDNYDSGTRQPHWPGDHRDDLLRKDGGPLGIPSTVYRPDPSPLDFDNDGFEDASNIAWPWAGVAPFDDCPLQFGPSRFGGTEGCPDADQDGWADSLDVFPAEPSQYLDTDGDGIGDNVSGVRPDRCVGQLDGSSLLRWTINGTVEWLGCPDADNDTYADMGDRYPSDDRFWSDSDNDGRPDQPDHAESDACPLQRGTSSADRIGCPDLDGDAFSDPDETWTASDGADAFPSQFTQWNDTDEDGYGDNWADTAWNVSRAGTVGQWMRNAFEPDACPTESGTSTHRWDNTTIPGPSLVPWLGCVDTDEDGIEDGSDDCPTEAGESRFLRFACADEDEDGYADVDDDCVEAAGTSRLGLIGCPDGDGDQIADSVDPDPYDGGGLPNDWDADGYTTAQDAFPLDPREWNDTDGDGHGDNVADAFPEDATQWSDTDGDGYGDNQHPNATTPDFCLLEAGNATEFPGLGCIDSDGDGWADRFDDFDDDETQWRDSDRDGFGDNASGTDPDLCPNNPGTSFRTASEGYGLGCPDDDRDGVPDGGVGPSAAQLDAFLDDSTQWKDTDGDRFGDNPLGSDADSCVTEAGNSTEGGLLGCVDSDGDGWADSIDVFDHDAAAWADSDGDNFTDQPATAYSDDCPNQWGKSTTPWRGCEDFDRDGIMDLTDPDTDGDGISDILEAEASLVDPDNNYSSESGLSVPLDSDGDGNPDLLDDDDDNDGWPDEVEVERGSDPLDPDETPLNVYGGSDSGTFYVPGKGFQSSYDPEGVELSASALQELVTSEFLIPLLLLPASLIAVTRKRRRYRRARRRLMHARDRSELEPWDTTIDQYIEKGRVKVEHGILLRNLYDRRRGQLASGSGEDALDYGSGGLGGGSGGGGFDPSSLVDASAVPQRGGDWRSGSGPAAQDSGPLGPEAFQNTLAAGSQRPQGPGPQSMSTRGRPGPGGPGGGGPGGPGGHGGPPGRYG